MFFLHEMVPGTESDQMSIVGRCWYGDTSSTSYVRMAQLIGQHL